MTRTLAIHILVDSCGWDVVGERPWFLPELAHRQEVASVLGDASAFAPAILSGLRPDESDHFCFLRWSPEESPFSSRAKWAKILPSSIARQAHVRELLSTQLAAELGLTGEFSVRGVPLRRLGEFDWTQKRDLFALGGLNRGESIFDWLTRRRVTYHVSDRRSLEERRFAEAERAVSEGRVEFALVHATELASIVRQHAHDRDRIDRYLRGLQARVRSLVTSARRKYAHVQVSLFSDHGTAEVTEHRDLQAEVDRLGLRWGHDYAAVFDSTMARFWFLTDYAEERIREALPDDARGGWISREREISLGVHWPDRRFGHAFYLLEPGQLICPSHLGHEPLRGMHGYRPDHMHSHAALLSDAPPAVPVRGLTDLFRCLQERPPVGALREAA